MANDSSSLSNGLTIGRAVILILLISLTGILLYRYFAQGQGPFDFGDYTSIPKEMQITYKPSDFNMDIDEEDALAILSNPRRYKREFDNLVYDINMSILSHVATRMSLPDSLLRRLRIEYDKQHPYLKGLYFNDFVTLMDTTSNVYQEWYENGNRNAVDAIYEIASKYTCFFVNHVISSMVETSEGKIFGKGRKVDTPCGIAITEALGPLMKRMEERAAIADFGRSKGLIEERVERVITELATMEVRDKKGINQQLKTRVLNLSVSSTDIEISAISIMKIGFRLNEYFDVELDSRSKDVVITLPEPTIISHEVYPKIDKLSIGWMREVKESDLNRTFNILREEFRRDAFDSDIMVKAKKRAAELMDTMFSPLISSLNAQYKLRVQFQRTDGDPFLNEEDSFDS